MRLGRAAVRGARREASGRVVLAERPTGGGWDGEASSEGRNERPECRVQVQNAVCWKAQQRSLVTCTIPDMHPGPKSPSPFGSDFGTLPLKLQGGPSLRPDGPREGFETWRSLIRWHGPSRQDKA